MSLMILAIFVSSSFVYFTKVNWNKIVDLRNIQEQTTAKPVLKYHLRKSKTGGILKQGFKIGGLFKQVFV